MQSRPSPELLGRIFWLKDPYRETRKKNHMKQKQLIWYSAATFCKGLAARRKVGLHFNILEHIHINWMAKGEREGSVLLGRLGEGASD